MRNKLRPELLRVLSKKNLKESNFISENFYEDFLSPMLKGDNKNIQLIWNVFMFHCWLERKEYMKDELIIHWTRKSC